MPFADKVTQMVSKRLGALLATDPTVTAGKPPAAVATGAGQRVMVARVEAIVAHGVVPIIAALTGTSCRTVWQCSASISARTFRVASASSAT